MRFGSLESGKGGKGRDTFEALRDHIRRLDTFNFKVSTLAQLVAGIGWYKCCCYSTAPSLCSPLQSRYEQLVVATISAPTRLPTLTHRLFPPSLPLPRQPSQGKSCLPACSALPCPAAAAVTVTTNSPTAAGRQGGGEGEELGKEMVPSLPSVTRTHEGRQDRPSLPRTAVCGG